jgi:hypothetical protein
MYLSSAVDLLSNYNNERDLRINHRYIRRNSLDNLNVINNLQSSINTLGILLDAIDQVEQYNINSQYDNTPLQWD